MSCELFQKSLTDEQKVIIFDNMDGDTRRQVIGKFFLNPTPVVSQENTTHKSVAFTKQENKCIHNLVKQYDEQKRLDKLTPQVFLDELYEILQPEHRHPPSVSAKLYRAKRDYLKRKGNIRSFMH